MLWLVNDGRHLGLRMFSCLAVVLGDMSRQAFERPSSAVVLASHKEEAGLHRSGLRQCGRCKDDRCI